MKKSLLGFALGASILFAGGAIAAGNKQDDQSACFDQMKKLVGDWVGKDPMTGKDAVMLRYKLTGGGSAVHETVMPGMGHEMVTLYTLDKGKLKLTHYCALGNQPHMAASADSTPAKIKFECVSVGNTKSHNEMHMHKGVLTLTGPNKLVSEWSSFPEDENAHKVKFELTRKSK